MTVRIIVDVFNLSYTNAKFGNKSYSIMDDLYRVKSIISYISRSFLLSGVQRQHVSTSYILNDIMHNLSWKVK